MHLMADPNLASTKKEISGMENYGKAEKACAAAF
jgi:hypothetical protein